MEIKSNRILKPFNLKLDRYHTDAVKYQVKHFLMTRYNKDLRNKQALGELATPDPYGHTLLWFDWFHVRDKIIRSIILTMTWSDNASSMLTRPHTGE